MHILAKAKDSIYSYFISNTKIAYLLVIGIIIGGLTSLYIIPKEDAPEIDYGIVIISTLYQGASSYDIDSLITQEIESKVKNILGINKITSTSSDNISIISLEFSPGTDMVKALGELRSKIDLAKANLPKDADEPQIEQVNSNQPLFDLYLSGEVHPVLLGDYAEGLKNSLEKLSYIQDINVSGGVDREIYVDLDPTKLDEFHLSPMQAISAITSANSDFPIGDIKIDNFKYNLRFQGKYSGIDDIKNLVISSKGSANLTINDIANIYEETRENEEINRLFDKGKSLNAVKLSIKKSSSSDIFVVDPLIRSQIQKYSSEHFGPEIKTNYLNERIKMVRKSYQDVSESLLEALVVVIVVLFIFVGIKESMAASLIIPLTFLATVAALKFMGFSLNFMTNFSMILALGIIVDTSIVLVQGIHSYIKSGHNAKDAAILAVFEFKAPLISSALTTLAVFIPLLSLPGILGKYLSYIPITVSLILIISLIASLFLIPATSLSFLKEQKEQNVIRKYSDSFQVFYHRKYQEFLDFILNSKVNRLIGIYGIIVLFALSMMLPSKFEMFPPDDFDFVFVNIETPIGQKTEITSQISHEIEKKIGLNPEVKYISSSIKDNKANLFVELYEKNFRQSQNLKTNKNLSEKLRNEFASIAEYNIRVTEPKKGPPGNAPVAFQIVIDDYKYIGNAKKVAEDLKTILKQIPGTTGIRDDLDNTPGEIKFRIDREKALALGINPESVPPIIRSAISGLEASHITRSGRETKILVRYHKDKIKNVNDILGIHLINNSGNSISFDQIAKQELTPGFANIKRTNGRIAVTVSSDLETNGNALEISNKFKKYIASYSFPEGTSILDVGENMENQKLFIALLIGFITSIFLIFTILVIQFNSFSNPLIILFTILMSQFGVNIGLYLLEYNRSLSFIIGVIALSGIVVNHSIILVDRINNFREEYPDKPLKQILIEACVSRLQPVMLTTIISIVGLLPMIWVDTFWAGLAITVIFGVAVSTVFTLFITPALYQQFDKEMAQTLLPIGIIITASISVLMLFASNYIGLIPACICLIMIIKLIRSFSQVHDKKLT